MFWADIRLRIGRFFRRYRKLVILLLIVWIIIVAINDFLKTNKQVETISTSYAPHQSIIGSTQTVPDDLQEPINTIIDTFFNYCQEKNYQAAYDMLSDGCKYVYFSNLIYFQEYVDTIFNEEKAYYIQNYSNYKDYYVYQVKIFENIMKTGLTGKDDLSFYEEKISIHNENGQLKLGLRQYITTEKMDDIYEDDYVKIWIEKKNVFYEQEVYTVKIKNKSNYIVVLADGQENYELLLSVGSSVRDTSSDNLNIVLQPGETETYDIKFNKFYDENNLSMSLLFNTVRVLKSYTGLDISKDYELKNAEKLYSINIPF